MDLLRAALLQQVAYRDAASLTSATSEFQQRLASVICELGERLSGEYLDSFLRDYFRHKTEFDDLLVEAWFSALTRPTHNIRYFCWSNHEVQIASSRHLVEQGTTGLHLWDSGIALAEYLVNNPHMVKRKRLLELGCGTGLVGTISYMVGASSVTLSDIGQVLYTSTAKNVPVGVKILELDWTCPLLIDYSQYDCILASDVLFDPELVMHLVDIVAKACEHSIAVLIAQEQRNQGTIDLFLSSLSSRGATWTVCDVPCCQLFFYKHEPIKLLFIQYSSSES